MKKLITFFGVFAVALLLMSMSNIKLNNISKHILLEELPDCFEQASINANNLACANYGEDYTYSEYYFYYSTLFNQCFTRGELI